MRAGSAIPKASGREAAQDIDWFEPATRVFDPAAGVYGRWFTGAVCNTCWNAVDRHVRDGRGSQPAIIYDSPLAGTQRTITYDRLLTETQVLAAILRDLGVAQGDRVILYMPMVPEAVIAMLACARIGAVHSVVFGGFAAASSPPASTTPGRRSSWRQAAGSSPAGWCTTSRCSTRRLRWRMPSPPPASSCSGRRSRPR